MEVGQPVWWVGRGILVLLAVAILLIGGTSAWDVDGYNFSGVHHTQL